MRVGRLHATAMLVVALAGCSGGESASGGDGGGSPDDSGSAVEAGGGGDTGAAVETGAPGEDGGDAASEAAPVQEAGGEGGGDAGVDGGCYPFGAPGTCITTTACAALGDHTSYPGYCPGPADIECCIVTPSTADNPPTPAGWVLMQQADVTSAMTTWAVMILDDPTDYPMFSTTTKVFGALTVLARVEWHPPDSNNETVHRGVTLYQPAG